MAYSLATRPFGRVCFESGITVCATFMSTELHRLKTPYRMCSTTFFASRQINICRRFLAPNGQSLLKVLSGPGLDPNARIDPKTPVREMTVNDWALLVKAFDEWPFAPEVRLSCNAQAHAAHELHRSFQSRMQLELTTKNMADARVQLLIH
jgi:hypothetical protein